MSQGEPAWFFSSLAQVTAAIVAFLGGFLTLRLQDQVKEWRALRIGLVSTQRRWLGAKRAAERFWDQYAKTQGTGPIEGPTPELDRENETWASLVDLIEEQKQSTLPRFFSIGAVALSMLLVVGVVLPLLDLDAPSDRMQAAYLAIFLLPLVGFASATAFVARAELRAVRTLRLWDRVVAEYENYLANVEMWEQQEEQTGETSSGSGSGGR